LTRVSVGQDGYNDNGLEGQLGSFLSGPSAGDATIVPAVATVNAKTVPARQDPSMSDDGSFVFFQSPVALAPGALNDVVDGHETPFSEELALYAQNFYEYHAGHVYLLASVTTEQGRKRSKLLGSDVSGSNVFFATFESLVPEDVDANLDFYDAHVCSGAAPCASPIVASERCGEGACQVSGGSPPGSGGVPASETFSGAGNLAPTAPSAAVVKPRTAARIRAEKLAEALKLCRRKHNKANRTKCERVAHRVFGARVSAMRAGGERGASR
jgi:hypothetical protein